MYNFDEVIDRRNTGSLKWNVGEDELPMWVADMDFPTAPAVTRALERRAAHGIFGYTEWGDAWYDAYLNWWRDRHGFAMEKEWLMFCTGVVPAISSTVRKLTTPAEKVVVQTPVYNIFFNSIRNNGRQVLEVPLAFDGTRYEMDFGALEQALADPQTTLMLLCNPQNPAGRIWQREELARVGELCRKHHVTVLSDEIHCDLTDPGKEYVPFASVSEDCRENSITCLAPTKSFNIAGLQTSAISVPNEALRHRVNRAINTDEVAEPNAFAIEAAIAAFTEGGEWLDALRDYLYQNKLLARAFLERELPTVKLVPSEATYLLWLDCRALGKESVRLAAELRRRTGLYLSAGSAYGKGGEGFLRMNIACPKATLTDGLARLKAGIEKIKA